MAKILVVDDEKEICLMQKVFFERRGHKVVIVTNPLEAMKTVESEKPQIVLLDVVMDGMSGLEVLKKIKEFNHKIKVIMVSVVDDAIKKEEALKLGADAYVGKPFNTFDLESVVMEQMEEFFGFRKEADNEPNH